MKWISCVGVFMVLSSTLYAGVFDGEKNPHFYWEALLQVSKGNKDKAEELVKKARQEVRHPDVFDWQQEVPTTVDSLFDRIFIDYVSGDPELLTTLGLFESLGVYSHNSYLSQRSPESLRLKQKQAEKHLALLDQFDDSVLSDSEWVSFHFVKWMVERNVEKKDFIFHTYFMNQMFGVLSDLDQTFTQMHTLEKVRDVKLYIKRLASIPEVLSQIIRTQEESRSLGIMPPKFAIDKCLQIISDHIEENVSEHMFFKYVESFFINHPVDDGDEFLTQVKDLLEKTVQPAYVRLKDYYEHLDVVENRGVWSLPSGADYYRLLLKEETTTDLTADEIHEIGLVEVKKIHEKVRNIFIQENRNDVSKTVGELLQELGKDSFFLFENTDEDRQICLQRYRDILKRSRRDLGKFFDLKPESGVEIEAVPEHLEEGMPGAYYYPPSLDGSRPGVFYANLRDMKEVPKFGMETLCIHEAEPGHHFQMTIQSETKMHVLRKILNVNATCEGWALYAEKFAYESDFYSTNFDKIGHFQDELLRAVRLVVDTGIHSKKWSREYAIEVMMDMTGYPHSTVATEIERYFVMPAQACSYKIGQIHLLGLREKMKNSLKLRYDVKNFHNEVLKAGNIPLILMDKVIERYIARVQ
ncbi:MAG: DUF885 family protein [Oligoflexales bacterium]